MVLISPLEYLASRMRFILFLSELKGALCCDSANTSFVVNKLINESQHVVDLNIDRYDMIIGRNLISGADMTINWYDSAIPWRDIDSTTNDMFALSQHNAPFNSETKRMKRILDAKYSKADIKIIAESFTHLDFHK